MTELLFAELAHLKGGKKQHWLRANAEVISGLAELLPFNDLCVKLNTKPETLAKALKRGERRAVVTRADKAYSKAIIAQEIAYEAKGKAESLDIRLNEHLATDAETLGQLSQFFQLLSLHSATMSKLLATAASRNLTEHIAYRNKRKVGLTNNNRARLSTYRSSRRFPLLGQRNSELERTPGAVAVSRRTDRGRERARVVEGFSVRRLPGSGRKSGLSLRKINSKSDASLGD